MDRPIVFLWIGLGFLLCGLPATGVCVWLVNAETARTSWPTVDGRVSSSSPSSYISQSSKGPNQLMYRPHVVYTYQVAGRPYESKRIGASTWGTTSKSSVEKYLEKYPEGGRVKVYYDAQNPADARLEVGVETGHVIAVLVSLLFDALGIWMLVLWRRNA